VKGMELGLVLALDLGRELGRKYLGMDLEAMFVVVGLDLVLGCMLENRLDSKLVMGLGLELGHASERLLAVVLEFWLVVSLVYPLEIDSKVVKLACWWLVELLVLVLVVEKELE